MRMQLLAAACSACVPLATSAAEPAITTPETVVTASRFLEPLGDRPVNMTVITAEQIANSPATTLPELLSMQAGITSRDFYGNGGAGATVDMRGFGATAAQNTLVLLDGRRINDIDLSGVEWGVIPLSAIARVEIIRGSGAVLYGSGAVSGVINIITRSPASEQRALDLYGRVGTYDTHQEQITGTLSGESAGLILGASNYHSDGYRDNNTNNTSAGFLDARWWTANTVLSFKAGLDQQDLRLPGPRLVDTSTGVNQLETDRRGTSTPLDYANRDGYRAAIEWEQQLDKLDYNIGIGYRDKEQNSYYDFGGFPDYREVDLGVWSVTPRMRVPLLAGRVSLVAGVDFYHWDYRLSISNSKQNIDTPINRVKADQDNTAGYVQAEARVTDTTTVTGGWRYETQYIDASDRYDAAAPGAAFGSGAPSGDQTDSETAWELAVRQDLTQSWAAFARAGRGYRFATVDEIYEFSPTFQREFQFLKPQTSVGYDLGAEYRTPSVFARATIFQLDVDNEIFLDPFRTGIGNTNLPPSRRRGLELEARWLPIQTLTLTGTYTYTRAEFREGTADAYGTSVDISGNRVPLVPLQHVSGQAAWGFAPNWMVTGTVQYVSSQYMENDQPNTGTQIPGYTTADVRLDYTIGALRLTGAVANVFDQEYYNYAVRSAFTETRYNAYPLPPRTFWAAVEYRFK